VHHAGNSSGIVDGASAVLIGNAEVGKRLRPEAPRAHPLVRIDRQRAHDHADRPLLLGGEGAEAGRHEGGDIDLYEFNEAFASVVLRFMEVLNVPHDKMNVNGGAIAMGHPLGATGAMILGTLLDELERRNKATGLATLCVGAGMGTATIIERI
jgi:acetyl-CoA C-acetyltransferase